MRGADRNECDDEGSPGGAGPKAAPPGPVFSPGKKRNLVHAIIGRKCFFVNNPGTAVFAVESKSLITSEPINGLQCSGVMLSAFACGGICVLNEQKVSRPGTINTNA